MTYMQGCGGSRGKAMPPPQTGNGIYDASLWVHCGSDIRWTQSPRAVLQTGAQPVLIREPGGRPCKGLKGMTGSDDRLASGVLPCESSWHWEEDRGHLRTWASGPSIPDGPHTLWPNAARLPWASLLARLRLDPRASAIFEEAVPGWKRPIVRTGLPCLACVGSGCCTISWRVCETWPWHGTSHRLLRGKKRWGRVSVGLFGLRVTLSRESHCRLTAHMLQCWTLDEHHFVRTRGGVMNPPISIQLQ